MRGRSTAVVAAALALGWLAACLFDSGVLAAVTAGCALAAPCCLASRRRRALVHSLGIVVLGSVSTVFLIAMATLDLSPTTALLLQLGYAAFLFPVLPALYAITLPGRDDDRDPQ